MINRSNKVVRYRWNGISRQGIKIKGTIEAITIDNAKTQLRKKGIITRQIIPVRNTFSNHFNRSSRSANITVFSRQMTTLLKAGLSLTQALDIISKSQYHHKMASMILLIKQDVENGLMLSESLRKHPMWFNPFFCNLIHLGESSGTLDIMFDKTATHNEKHWKAKKKIKKALTYPLAVIIIALFITAGLLVFVMPQFDVLFASLGADLPRLTRCIIRFSHVIQFYWHIIAVTIACAVYVLNYTYKHSPRVGQMIEKIMLNLPIIGKLLQKAIIARFARTLSILFAAGVPLVDALNAVATISGSILYGKATHQISQDISNGHRMQFAMESTALFPCMVTQMISIGEASGTLDKMLDKIADVYENDVDCSLDLLNDVLEPLIMTFLGLLVGGLVLALYLPIINLGVVL